MDALFDQITDALKGGDDVRLAPLGTFSAKDIGAMKGRNPRTGAEIDIAAHKRPGFKASKTLKDALN